MPLSGDIRLRLDAATVERVEERRKELGLPTRSKTVRRLVHQALARPAGLGATPKTYAEALALLADYAVSGDARAAAALARELRDADDGDGAFSALS